MRISHRSENVPSSCRSCWSLLIIKTTDIRADVIIYGGSGGAEHLVSYQVALHRHDGI